VSRVARGGGEGFQLAEIGARAGEEEEVAGHWVRLAQSRDQVTRSKATTVPEEHSIMG
jgi:hypothetical protein